MSTRGNYKSLTREDVEKVILYDPVEGSFFKKSTGNKIHINQYTEPNQTPKIKFTISSVLYTAQVHNLAWLLHYGYHPEGVVIHRDRNKCNLKISNLLDVSQKHYKALLTAYRNLEENCKIMLHPNNQYKFIVGFITKGKMQYKLFDDDSAAKEYIKIKRRQFIKQIRLLGGVLPENYLTELELL